MEGLSLALRYVYTQYTYKNFAVKAKTTFGQGGEHMNLMSGYAKVDTMDDGSWEYASLRNSSSWLSLSYGKNKLRRIVVFAYIISHFCLYVNRIAICKMTNFEFMICA